MLYLVLRMPRKLVGRGLFHLLDPRALWAHVQVVYLVPADSLAASFLALLECGTSLGWSRVNAVAL